MRGAKTMIEQFLSTPSARRATPRRQVLSHLRLISIHALREEGDPRTADSGSTGNDFYPRPPRGGRQDGGDYLLTGKLFLSTPSARRATVVVDERDLREVISIHALREEGDGGHPGAPRAGADFYPRPPRGGRRFSAPLFVGYPRFLSTPSARRATDELHGDNSPEQFLSTPSARRATSTTSTSGAFTIFLSTPSARRATSSDNLDIVDVGISIHALREEGDDDLIQIDFRDQISIHALREEGDEVFILPKMRVSYFYPRPPRGGRP